MTVVAALALALAVLAAGAGRGSRRRVPRPAPGGAARVPPKLLATVGVVGSIGLVAGLGVRVVAVLVAAIGVVLARRARAGRQDPVADHALVIDLLAGCLAAGATPPAAVAAAAEAAIPSVADALRTTGQRLRAGDDPPATWAAFGDAVPQLRDVSRACARTSATGAAVAAELRRLAARERARHQAAQRRAVARAAVWLVLPLGLCFLPAFVLVGVAPLLVAGVGHVLR